MTVNPLAQITAAVKGHNQGPGPGKDDNAKIVATARQFEGVLMTQLLQVLWKSSPEMSEGKGGMYQSMYEGAFADHLVAGGGIGLTDMIAKSMGATTTKLQGAGMTRHVESLPNKLVGVTDPRTLVAGARALHPQTTGSLLKTSRPASAEVSGQLEPPVGMMADVTAAASSMLASGGQQWAKQGRLAKDDFGSVPAIGEAAGAQASQSVRTQFGYQGYYKCNLFAFELARRAGLDTPLSTRGGTIGFPSSNRVTQDASDGSLDTGWAKVATGASPATMQDALSAGEAAFMLVGQGSGERHGHMAVIEHPRSIDYDADGKIRSISFDGWEAQPDGARHLTQRTWNRAGERGAPGDRNGLERIEVIQLNRAHSAPESVTQAAPQVGPARPAKFGP